MRHLSKLFVIGALISATAGVGPAGAARPDPPAEPSVTIGDVSVECVDGGISVFVAGVTTDMGSVTDVNIHAARIGRVKAVLIPYQPTYQQESWGFGWWDGSGDSMPTTLALDTTDAWGVSWTNHSVMGPAANFDSTSFWDVGVWAGAVNSGSGKGNRGGNSTWGWADSNWTVDCSTGEMTQNPEFEWCWEDEWSHEQGFAGPVRWDENEERYELC